VDQEITAYIIGHIRGRYTYIKRGLQMKALAKVEPMPHMILCMYTKSQNHTPGAHFGLIKIFNEPISL
jgi:hypothetical protein